MAEFPRRNVESCSVCRKRRVCEQSKDDADKTVGGEKHGPSRVPSWAPHYCLRECIKLTPAQRTAKRTEIREAQRKKPTAKFAYPIIGGPLDGEYAITSDFYSGSGKEGDTYYRPEGIYYHLSRQYEEFNAAHGGRKVLGGSPSMVFIHTSLLKPLARPKDR